MMMVKVPMLLDEEWSKRFDLILDGPGQEKRCGCGSTLPVGQRPLNTNKERRWSESAPAPPKTRPRYGAAPLEGRSFSQPSKDRE